MAKATASKDVIKAKRDHRAQKPEEMKPIAKPRLTLQVLWGCEVYNAIPKEAARKVVADLLEQLSQGGAVTVHVAEEDGPEYMLEVCAVSK
jgi:phosphoribosyl-dephospho-CoA transferase